LVLGCSLDGIHRHSPPRGISHRHVLRAPSCRANAPPLAQARLQQQLLLTITTDEVLAVPRILFNTADGTRIYATPSAQNGSKQRIRVELASANSGQRFVV